MKLRKIMLMMTVATMVFMSACGNTENKGTSDSKQEEVNNEEKENEQITIENEESSLLTSTYKVPLKEMYIDVPDMHYMEEGYTQVFYEDQVKYAAFTFLPDETAENAEDALDVSFEYLKLNMSGLHYINSIGEITTENKTINGIDVYTFEGNFNCGETINYDAYVKGYSFIYADMPCSIVGVVMGEEQPQEQIDAVKEIIDAMILTVRSEK